VVVIVAASVVTAVAYVGSAGEGYSPFNHYISELGERRNSELAALFNAGLMVTGALLATFYVGLARIIGGRFGRVLVALGIVDGIAASLVGWYSMDDLRIHRLVSLTFFVVGLVITSSLSVWLVRARRPPLPRWLAIPGALTALAFLGFLVTYALDTTPAADQLGPIVDRPAFSLLTTLEWATLAGMICFVGCASFVLLRRPVPTGAALSGDEPAPGLPAAGSSLRG